MTLLEGIVRLVTGLLLVGANAFFVATEFALTRLRQIDPKELHEDPSLKRAWEMTERLEIYLTGCQLGISATSILLGIVAEPAVTHGLEPIFEAVGLEGLAARSTSVVIAVILINLVHKIWGEQAPTYLGVEKPLGVLRHLSSGLFWWTKTMKPLILFGDSAAKWTLSLIGVKIERSWLEAEEKGPITTYTELRSRLKQLLGRGKLPKDRRQEILAALEIEELPVREIMVPRGEIVALSTTSSNEKNLATVRETGFNRYPLVGDSLEDFRGTVYVPAIFRKLPALRAGDCTFEDVADEPMVLRADEPVSRVIDRFQEARQELALVREVEDDDSADGDDQIVGLVTATDTFEAIAGELEDPYD